MKKFLGLIVALVLTVSSVTMTFGYGVMANAQILDDADAYFTEFVLSDATFEGNLSYSHTPLYNADLSAHGREYTFSVGSVDGYALMVEFNSADKTFYEIEELFYYRTSPFADCEGLPVYLSHNVYLEYKNQSFFDLATSSEVSLDAVLELASNGFNYYGGTTATYTNSTITIEYETKTTEQYHIPYDLPNILGSVEGGCCAHTAAASILTYYDRFCENIIPDFVPYITLGSGICYRSTNSEISDMTLELVDLMLIGEPHEGVTFSEFQLGMETYVEQQGYTYTSTNLFSNGSFNFNNYKNAVESGKPCAIFLTNFTMLNGYVVGEEEGKETVSIAYCPVSHVVAGCGYKIDTYYDANNNVISQRTYLKVASGLISYGIGYLSLNGESAVSKAISVLVS